MNLNKLVVDIENISKTISFADEIAKLNLSKKPEVAKWWEEDQYYRMLAGVCKLCNIQHAAEIGTMYGGSAVALAKYAKHVTAYDINFSNIVDEQIFSWNIQKCLLESPDHCLQVPFLTHDFIFIDIGNHDGVYEREIHKILLRDKYCGLVFYDDINWQGMRKVWNEIKNEKLEVNWHGLSGFGIVNYI